MKKDERSGINPFTGKSHLDLINDDEFLSQCEKEYNKVIQTKRLKDNDKDGIVINEVASNLINAVESYLATIGRSDYTRNYYDWEFHVVDENVMNAFCMPGGKIVFFSGMFNVIDSVDEVAFILAHEMAHALLDHSRTQLSAQNVKNGLTSIARIGSLGLALAGFGEVAYLARTITNIADISSEYFIMKPFGRGHEIEADKLGMYIVHMAGYNINAMPEFWQRFSEKSSNSYDFFSTHPADSKRISAMKEVIADIDNGVDFLNNPILGDTDSKSSDNEIKCNNCGNPLDVNDKFCINCGSEVVKSLSNDIHVFKDRCPVCGEQIEQNSNFCINCGSELNSASFDDNSVSKVLVCSVCGEEVEDGNNFCINCGSELKFNSIGDVHVKDSVLDDSVSKVLVCSVCGEEVEDGNNFCINCGSEINTENSLKEKAVANKKNICPHCGGKVNESNKYCIHCGKEINNVCYYCGNVISHDDKFCNKCGRNINRNIFSCPECGERISIYDKFCINCGRKLDN